jgi:hypothetical protein
MADHHGLNEREEHYLNWLLVPPADRWPASQQKYCDEYGVDPTTVRRWQKKPAFVKEWERRVEELQGSPERTQRLYDALYEKAIGGDVRAAKLYLEATHRLTPAVPVSSQAAKNMAELSDDELDQLIGQLAEREKRSRQNPQLKAI